MDGGGEAPDHYFTERPRSRSARRTLRFLYRGEVLSFEVDRGIFAASGLDPGTALLVEAMAPGPSEAILDLGCGWGAVGVAAAKAAPRGRVVLVDVNRRATGLAKGNLARNGIAGAEVRVGSLYGPVAGERFDLIVSNPPYRAGRPTILALLEGAPDHLRPGGRLLIVGKGSQGILFYQHWLEDRWERVEVLGRGGGYRVVQAVGPPTSRQA
ncbi:MAG TPA: methyltransferase [Thermoplasmata archaeon]|nr:methyltransferase [Thermoplasmata archaeon]